MRRLLITALWGLAAIIGALAGNYDPGMALPQDSSIVYGKLGNGFEYYIYRCRRPAYKVNFYLLENAGCVVEKEDQRGMAHFIEHMAFNGTANFPGKSLVETLEGYGIRFGYDINAYTGQDATVFRICDIDSRNGMGQIDTCLLALKDISCALTLDEQAIERERAIILEEWRQGNDATQRLIGKMFPVLFGEGHPYTQIPIGTRQAVEGFKAKDLRNFYKTWYQPQHQAIIVVGYIDPLEIEAKVKELWGKVKPHGKKSVRQWAQIDNHQGVRAAVVTDPEFTGSQIDLWFKVDLPEREHRNTVGYINESYSGFMANYILTKRFGDILYKGSSPWSYANADYSQFYSADSKDSFRLFALYDRSRRDEALQRLVAEAKRAAEYGITDDELDMAKQYMQSMADKLPTIFDEKNNYEHFDRISEHFLKGNVVLSLDDEQKTFKNFADTVSREAINSFINRHVRPDNLVALMVENSSSTGLPSDSELREKILELWANSEVAPLDTNDAYRRPLIDYDIEPGKIAEYASDSIFDARCYRLSNGARVIVCRRNVLADQIDMRAVQRGGESVLLDSGYVEGYYASKLADLGGIGDFSVMDLSRKFSGKSINIETTHTAYAEMIEGESSVDELETLLQLYYLRMTGVRRDDDAIANWRKTARARIADHANDPVTVLSDSIYSVMYGKDNKYIRRPTIEDIDTLDIDKALRLYEQRIANPAAFDYIIVGNVEYDTVEPLIEKYIGSLPGDGWAEREPFHKVNRFAREGERKVRFSKKMPSAVTSVYQAYEIRRPYNLLDEMTLEVLGSILEKMYIDQLRDEQGGTYTPHVSTTSGEVDGFHSLVISFETNAEAAERLLLLAHNILAGIAANGPDEDLYESTVTYLANQEYTQSLQQRFPMRFFTHLCLYGDDDYLQRYSATVSVLPEDVRAMAEELLNAPSQTIIILDGVEEENTPVN